MPTGAGLADRVIGRFGSRWPRLVATLHLREVAGAAAAVFAIRVVGAGLAYFSLILLVHWLGEFQFGIYAYVWSWASFFGIVVSLGLNSTVLRFIPEYRTRGFARRLAGIVVHSRTAVMLSGIAFALVGIVATVLAESLVPEHFFVPVLLGFACVPLIAFVALYEGMWRALGRPAMAYGPSYVVHPMMLMAGVWLALVMGAAPNATTAVAVAVVTCATVLAIQCAPLPAAVRAAAPHAAPRRHGRYWFAISLPLMFMEMCRALMEQTDILALGSLSTPEDVAAYFATARTAGLLGFISFAVAAIAVPRMSALHAAGSRAALQNLVRGVVHFAFWPSLAGVVALAVVGPFVLELFDPHFVRAYPALLVLAVGFLIRAATGPAEYLLMVTGHQRVTARIVMGAAAFNLIANLALIPAFGLLGAAIATATAVTLANGALVFEVRRRLGIRCWIADLGAPGDSDPSDGAATSRRARTR